MTTNPVMSITDEQIAEIERFIGFGGSFIKVKSSALTDIISRLRAAEMDAARLDKLDAIGYAYGFEDMHEGNRWMVYGPYRDIRAAIDDIHDTAMKGEQQ